MALGADGVKESSALHRILLACSNGATRLFRCNSGVAWQGRGDPVRVSRAAPVMMYPGDVLLRAAQPLQMGLTTGGSDLIGWTTQDGVARFTAIEVKSDRGRLRPEQAVFIDAVNTAGGIAGVARSEDEAQRIINGDSLLAK
jgi:hypothetical protein